MGQCKAMSQETGTDPTEVRRVCAYQSTRLARHPSVLSFYCTPF